jgi:hypothetical protein
MESMDRKKRTANYLPFFATADPAMPILYLTTPKVKEM